VWGLSPPIGLVCRFGGAKDGGFDPGLIANPRFAQVVPIITGEKYFLHFSALLAALRVRARAGEMGDKIIDSHGSTPTPQQRHTPDDLTRKRAVFWMNDIACSLK
jgi:hypothetical protein